jgi:putative FmdB family regulatory protein
MHVYDYLCNDCHKTFERSLTLHEHDSQQMRCPHCGGKKIEQVVTAFYAVTSKKSA